MCVLEYGGQEDLFGNQDVFRKIIYSKLLKEVFIILRGLYEKN